MTTSVRLAHGAYNIAKGDRVGVINFSALIPNYLATNKFDMAITSGTGQFHSARGYILITPSKEVNGFLERNATLYNCGLYEERDASQSKSYPADNIWFVYQTEGINVYSRTVISTL
jgi:hypothetical protein